MKQEKKIITGGVILAILALLIFSVPPVTGQNENDNHPELSDQEMLRACADCHREATPDIERNGSTRCMVSRWSNAINAMVHSKP